MIFFLEQKRWKTVTTSRNTSDSSPAILCHSSFCSSSLPLSSPPASLATPTTSGHPTIPAPRTSLLQVGLFQGAVLLQDRPNRHQLPLRLITGNVTGESQFLNPSNLPRIARCLGGSLFPCSAILGDADDCGCCQWVVA